MEDRGWYEGIRNAVTARSPQEEDALERECWRLGVGRRQHLQNPSDIYLFFLHSLIRHFFLSVLFSNILNYFSHVSQYLLRMH